MPRQKRRTLTIFALGLLTAIVVCVVPPTHSASANSTIPPTPPQLFNDDFECSVGYYEVPGSPSSRPNHVHEGWTLVVLDDTPRINSARIQFDRSCGNTGGHVEKISGDDSFTVLARDIETPPEPGKPFDIAVYQQTASEPGGAYSVSGWFLTLCGGSAVPNDCPDDVYMAKMLGLDPTGGIDPAAESVVWVENRANFVDENDERIGWSNLYTTAVSEAYTMTVFARIDSPFQWHGNHGFVDAISLIRAPVADFVDLPSEVISDTATIVWDGEESPDVADVPGGNFHHYYDVEVRHESEEAWRTLVAGSDGPGQIDFQARCVGSSYNFRVRARAEQPEDEPGASPNQRYPGPWSDVGTIFFPAETSGEPPEPLPFPIFFPLAMTEAVEC